MGSSPSKREILFEQTEALQNLLVSIATGGPGENQKYRDLRSAVLAEPDLNSCAPRFLRTCRDTGQFWQQIKLKFGTYAERRSYLWDQFRPMLEALEQEGVVPSDREVSDVIERLDASSVRTAWQKALERKASDPEGAITMARTLLESVCKYILEEENVECGDSPDINKLYKLTAEQLKLAPSQHTEQVFKQILGGCVSVVEGLGALRNRLSDAHGRTKAAVKPAPRHAELAVNLAGVLATYLLSIWQAHRETDV